MADRAVLQVNRTKPEGDDRSGHLGESCADAVMDRYVRILVAYVVKVQIKARPVCAADVPTITATIHSWCHFEGYGTAVLRSTETICQIFV